MKTNSMAFAILLVLCAVLTHHTAYADTCAWSDLGFNPFNRWNTLALTGDTHVYGASSVEGRVAGVGAVTIHGTAEVHTVKQGSSQKSSNTKWSVTGGDGVSLEFQAVVHNGGVEAANTIVAQASSWVEGDLLTVANGGVTKDAAALVSGSVIDNNAPPLSADLQVAKTYFSERSQFYKSQTSNAIRVDPISNDILRVRVHGKLNIINEIDADQLGLLDSIVLEGNPKGVVVFNVASSGTLPTANQVYLNKAITVKYVQDNVEAPVAFGRVLFNFYEATVVMFTFSSAQGSSQVSILAPLAAVTLESASIVKGNLVGASIGIAGKVEAQAFGASSAGNRTPRKFTAGNGKSQVPPGFSWACLWGAF